MANTKMYGTSTHTFFKFLKQSAIWRLAAQSHCKLQEKAKEGLPIKTIMRLAAQKPIAGLKHQSGWKLAIQKPWKLATQSWWKFAVQANQSLYNTKPAKAYIEHKAHQSLHCSYEIVICFHAAGLHTFASKKIEMQIVALGFSFPKHLACDQLCSNTCACSISSHACWYDAPFLHVNKTIARSNG